MFTVTDWVESVTVIVPVAATVSPPRVTLRLNDSISWSASGIVIDSVRSTVTAGVLRVQWTLRDTSGYAVSPFVTENDTLKMRGCVPSLTNPTADAGNEAGEYCVAGIV